MRMKMVCDDRTLREVSNEFLALKKVLKVEILEYFADISMFVSSIITGQLLPWATKPSLVQDRTVLRLAVLFQCLLFLDKCKNLKDSALFVYAPFIFLPRNMV